MDENLLTIMSGFLKDLKNYLVEVDYELSIEELVGLYDFKNDIGLVGDQIIEIVQLKNNITILRNCKK